MPKLIIALLASFYIITANSAWAQSQANMEPLFYNPAIDMVYPQVSGDYLVYTQRVNHRFQVIRLNKQDLNGKSKDISPKFKNETVRNALLLEDGTIAYLSNRLGFITPWLSKAHQDHALGLAAFQSLLIPNHLDSSNDGKIWVFDSTLETTRTPRIINQFSDGFIQTELVGQAWRMYHSKFWAFKSGYAQSKTGVKSKFNQPHLFTITQDNGNVAMLGDGFDATLSSDGSMMVFVRETDGNFDLWQQNIDGSGLKRLTRSVFADLEPSFSADDKHITFISNRDAGGDILQTSVYTLELATGKIKRITHGSNVADGGPSWLDNNTIIFHSNRDPDAPNTNTVDNWRLWTVKVQP